MKTTMTTWIRLPGKFDGETVKVRGVDLVIQISPLDAPKAVRGEYRPDRGVFRIEFKYPDREEGELVPGPECVSLELGRHSRKLLGIEVAVDEHDLDAVRLVHRVFDKADLAVAHLRSTPQRPNARLNYGAIDRVLRDRNTQETFVTALQPA